MKIDGKFKIFAFLLIFVFFFNIKGTAETSRVAQSTDEKQDLLNQAQNDSNLLLRLRVPFKEKGFWGQQETTRFVFGSASVINPLDPAFENTIHLYNYETMQKCYDAGNSYLLTNYHVIADYKNGLPIHLICLRPATETEPEKTWQFEVTIVGSDPYFDVAILELEGVKLKAITLGDAKKN